MFFYINGDTACLRFLPYTHMELEENLRISGIRICIRIAQPAIPDFFRHSRMKISNRCATIGFSWRAEQQQVVYNVAELDQRGTLRVMV